MKKVKSTLNETLKMLGISKNKLAVESKIRPNTISDLANGKSQAINFETLENIINTLDRLAIENNINKSHSVSDVFKVQDQD
ncbi:helix-turn-helix domain-containing protein [Gracilibacillus sp. HCP3S3_G5_1]|uniref:helix-turn-helix domain-containing protein n=1 Tax=unclassified Gracilibacillus TaxID=2625209 RepID=UPI003F8993A5